MEASATTNNNYSSSTQTIEISIHDTESGVPIYATNVCPIQWSQKPPSPSSTPIEGVPGAFMISDVFTADEW